MALFVLSDLHLSTAVETDKSMEVFGHRWQNYTERIQKNWSALVDENDTVVIGGDVSWALSLEEATSDFSFLHALPGKKIILKGNHDFWWTTLQKMTNFLNANGFCDMAFLQNNAFLCDSFIICGSRGWFYETDTAAAATGADYDKMIAREAHRLSLSLTQGKALQESLEKETELIAFLHFPPIWNGAVCEPILQTLKDFGIKRCYFGHIHGVSETSFEAEGIEFILTAADALGFMPKAIF
ncbi:MAG: metallophosphoesterase [Clostridia bacterium]|nr:metallophosphoesterase [Clostridia bacterium]